MALKRYSLTQIGGNKDDKRVYARRDAACPIIAHVTHAKSEDLDSVPCWLVNISEDGCMITSDYFPKRVKTVEIVVPGFSNRLIGYAKTQGNYTLNVIFDSLLDSNQVELIGRITMVKKSS